MERTDENGEELLGVASSDPSDLFQHKSDGGDASPVSSLNYSSCGESEFERYCSANSVMGTPSMCSSTGAFNDCIESEFGSLKSRGFCDLADLENFSLGPSQKVSSLGRSCLDDERVVFKEGISMGSNEERIDTGYEANSGTIVDNVDRSRVEGTGNGGSIECNLVSVRVSNGEIVGDSTLHLVVQKREECVHGLESQFLGSEMEKGEDGNSSRYEHSEGEDSMYGSDDDQRNNSYYQRDICYQQKPKPKNENPLVMGSSVAFGSDDWDGFELESGPGTEDPLSLYTLKQQKHDFESEEIVLRPPTMALPESGHVDQAGVNNQEDDHLNGNIYNSLTFIDHKDPGKIEQVEEAKDSKIMGTYEGPSAADIRTMSFPGLHGNTSVSGNQNEGDAPLKVKYLQNIDSDADLEMMPNELGGTDLLAIGSKKESIVQVSEDQELGTLQTQGPTYANDYVEQLYTVYTENAKMSSPQDYTPKLPCVYGNNVRVSSKDSSSATDLFEEDAALLKAENVELNDFYDDFVHDMEEILLDNGETSGARFTNGDKMFRPQLSLPLRDGGQTATTSGLDDSSVIISQQFKIDGVEVVGAKQKKGDVSLSERLVGVREYTVYVIRVWSGQDEWEVERRYREFLTLYRQFKSLSADQGWVLPPPWSSMESESKKVFGTSPNVIAERSVLIQECLRSILRSRFSTTPPDALLRFLSPQNTYPGSPQSDVLVSHSRSFCRETNMQNTPTLGKTISLIVEIRPHKSVKQLLEAQQHCCVGCHKYLDVGTNVVRDFVKALGWGQLRLCEYTGQLFCSSCHTNDTAVLPARVLHQWDFNRYPVSQLAKSYLDSIFEQPMLCVSAVNPFLFSKVPALNHVMSIRKKLGSIIPYIRCPFRLTVNKRLGSRRYLLESNDFFALRDLVDLSKGAFSALPGIVETVLRKILEHIMEQCLVCCDVGAACSARHACNDPSSLIFPFQEEEIEKCPSCESVYHKKCFTKLSNCHCGAQLGDDKTLGPSKSSVGETSGELEVLGRRSASASGSSVLPLRLLSRLFSKSNKESDTVILMGSMPSNDL